MTVKELMSILGISTADIKSYLEIRYSQIISEYQNGKFDSNERERQLEELDLVTKQIMEAE